MSDDKKVTDKAGEIAKNIWLAGVGAYGKAVEDAQGRIEKAMEPPKLFRDLVKAGSALEDEAREALETASSARGSVEERISKVRENFHNQRPARIEDLLELNKKVDRLNRKIDKLTKALTEQGVLKDSPPKKGAAAAKRKPDIRKAPKRKPAAKKTAAAKQKTTASKKKATARRKTPTRRA